VKAVWPPTSSCAEQVFGHERSTSAGCSVEAEPVLSGSDFRRPAANAKALDAGIRKNEPI
jgi:hypothetical protein